MGFKFHAKRFDFGGSEVRLSLSDFRRIAQNPKPKPKPPTNLLGLRKMGDPILGLGLRVRDIFRSQGLGGNRDVGFRVSETKGFGRPHGDRNVGIAGSAHGSQELGLSFRSRGKLSGSSFSRGRFRGLAQSRSHGTMA